MRRWKISAVIIVVVAVIAVVWFALGTTDTKSSQSNPTPIYTPTPQGTKVLNVAELMTNPSHYTGIVEVEGVVSVVSPEEQAIAIIDTSEFFKCGITTCPSFELPVRWSGVMPHVRDIVRVTGVIQSEGGKLIFSANILDITQQQTGSPQ